MENKGWGLQAWHALCCSLPSHCSEDNHKLLPVRCSELSDGHSANPELPQVYPYPGMPAGWCCHELTDTNPKIPLYFCCFLEHYSCISSQPKSKLTPSAVQRWERKALHCLSLWTCQAPFHTCPSAFQTGFQVEIYLWCTGLIKILHPLLDCVVPFQIIHFMKHAWNQILSLQINKMVLTISFYIFYHLLKCWK